MHQTGLRVLMVFVIAFICGVVGWILGALIGGNFAGQFVFNGVRGYEATGKVGFLLGDLIGLFIGWRLFFKKRQPARG